MIDILLVHPAATHGIYGVLGDQLVAVEPPLWPRLIAGYLIDKGWSVRICDMEAERLQPHQVANDVEDLSVRVVAICCYGHQPSASTQQMVGAHAVAVAIKEHKWSSRSTKRPIVVMLGNHPSALPVQTLQSEPIDYIIDGEGPTSLDALLRANLNGGDIELEKIPGLVWRTAGRVLEPAIMQNPRAPLLDLDRDLHGNAWHLLPPLSSFRAHNWQTLDGWPRSPYAAIYTSLGCSFRCDFCMINIFQHSNNYRRRDPGLVIQEILRLYEEHDVRTFKITDELFVLNRNHYLEICEGIVALGIGDLINIWAYSRTDTVHVGDLPLMRAAGIRWLALGIEAADSHVRAQSSKALRTDLSAAASGTPNADITRTVRNIQSAGINVIGNYIFGLPDDTHETMQATLDLALELNTEWANFYCAMPYPGSPLYERIARERPQDLPPTFAAYSQHNRHTVPLCNANLTAAEILKFRDDSFEKYFFDNLPFHDLLKRKFGQGALDEIERMKEYGRLPRDILAL